jgi:TonB family protein
MFDKLVVSAYERRRHSRSKFFVTTAALYVFAIGAALAVSVFVSDPKLADSKVVTQIVQLPPGLDGGYKPKGPKPASTPARPPDYTKVKKLEGLMAHREVGPPRVPIFDRDSAHSEMGLGGGPLGPGSSIGVSGGEGGIAPPPPKPDPPRPQPAAQPNPASDAPLRVVSQVLQGKAIERVVPVYPELMKRIRLEGDVSVEVIISPEGRVESARAVSGHPMLASAAVDAARRWRFQPTLLNHVPVRVTGVIVFAFKLTN